MSGFDDFGTTGNNRDTTRKIALDDVELLHLAMSAMRSDRQDEAMILLKRAIHASPDNARAHYLLGAHHAQIGLYDRAVTEIAEAVRLDPSLSTAHFQLGLLHLTAGRTGEAQKAWKPLDELATDDPFRLFKSALLHLVRDDWTQCIDELEAGIARNKVNEALNDDMRRLLADLTSRQTGTNAPGGSEPSGASASESTAQMPAPSKRMLLSTYDQNRNDTGTD
jgi:tetratricopeptide (TPR) repeat protein